jgi:predicted nucleic acid-binding Zn ribbon protein
MARGRFRSLGQLLPSALDGVAQRAANGGALGPAWSQAVGAPIARIARPVALRGGILEVEVDNATWAKELEGRVPDLLQRLQGPFAGRVKKLAFRVSKGRSRP